MWKRKKTTKGSFVIAMWSASWAASAEAVPNIFFGHSFMQEANVEATSKMHWEGEVWNPSFDMLLQRNFPH